MDSRAAMLAVLACLVPLRVLSQEASTPGITPEQVEQVEPEVGDPRRDAETKPPQVVSVVYEPPPRGSPRGRIGGGVRGSAVALPSLYALVPEHIGETSVEQPSLFWSVDAEIPRGLRLYFTLFDEGSIDPVVEQELPRPERPGIQRIDLAALGVRLAPNTEYEWTVALVVDPQHRSQDIVAAGWIDRVERPRGEQIGGALTPAAYAKLGLWYDALSSLSEEIRAHPGDAALRSTRDQLLRQVGLTISIETED